MDKLAPRSSKEMAKELPHLAEFFPFIESLNKESDRGKVLITTGFLEEQLKKVLVAFFVDGANVEALFESGNAPLGTFSARAHVAHALGLIREEEYADLTLIRRIRNEFAHDITASFERPDHREPMLAAAAQS